MKASTYFLIFITISFFGTLQAQDDDLTTALIKGLGDSGAEKKAKMDSLDFQFAISINENAGFFDVQQKGEGGANFLYAFKEQKDKAPSEIARDTLEYAIGLYEIRWYKMAETALRDAKALMEQYNLQGDISYLRCLSNIGLVYLAQGRTAEAKEYIDQCLQKSESALGIRSAAYVSNLNSQAKLDQMLGKYNEAEKAFDETLSLVKDVFTNKSMQYAIVLNNKAMLFQNMGRYDEAIALMKEAIKVSESAPKKFLEGKKSFDSRKFQSNLALLYQLAGKHTEAEATFNIIKKIFESRGQTKNMEYASLLNQMALLYIAMGKKQPVEEMINRAAEIYKKKFTEENPYYAKSVSDLGNFHRMEMRYPQAEKLLLKSLAIKERTLGASHPDYVETREDVAILYWKMGQPDKAYDHYKFVMDKTIDFINQYFPPMSEAEKTKYWDITFPRFQRFYNFALSMAEAKPEITRDIYDYQTATKALLLNATNKIKQAILKSGNKTLIADYLQWLDKKEMLARYYSLSKEDLKQQKIDLAALENETNQIERSLSARSSDFTSGYSTQKISFTQIRDLLLPTDAVVEVIRVHSYDHQFTAESKYIVLVLTKEMQVPKLIVLDNGTQLESRYAKYYRNAIQQRMADEYSYAQYWSKIDPAISGKKNIYLSPDGVFNQINVNTIQYPDGNFTINRYDLTILGNSKDLIALKNKKASVPKKNAMLLGFPDYDGENFAALPGTKAEIDNLSKILKTSGYQIVPLLQKQASEQNLKATKGTSIMHLATHGYFLQDTESGSNFGIHADNAANNPLLRSGLILAGASKTVSGTKSPDIESNDNGILTAYEAMNLDLENTDMIILSACETGLGDVKNGEGVYGLQRAFLVAGADAMIMSLWKVDDTATQQLMTNFYTNWIKLGNKPKAFKQAQIQLMTKYKEPYYWGAFVMMGQ